MDDDNFSLDFNSKEFLSKDDFLNSLSPEDMEKYVLALTEESELYFNGVENQNERN